MAVVSIVIPNLNGKHLLKNCLPTVFAQSFSDFEIIVVDNGSTDGSLAFLKKNFPQVQIVANKTNLGFAKAVNLAIKQTSSDFIVLLNNDTKLDKHWLENLVKAANNHPECASIAPKILSINGKTIENAGDGINIVGQAFPIGKGEPISKYSKPRPILGATGGASLFKKRVFNKIGLFDEDFFFYFEDVDWALRAQLSGFKSYFEPKAVVYHDFGQTAKKFGNFIEYLRFRNTIYMVIKNFPFQLFFKRNRWWKIPLVFLHTFYFFGKRGMVLPAFHVLFDVLIQLPSLIAKRRKIMRNITVNIDYFDNLAQDKKLKIFFWKI